MLTTSAENGLISQSEFFDKVIAGKDKSSYSLIHRNEFVFNRSHSNGYPFGAIKRLTQFDVGIVSPLYICFSIGNKQVSFDYIEQYFEAGLVNHEFKMITQEGARNHGLLNIAVDDFFNMQILLPR